MELYYAARGKRRYYTGESFWRGRDQPSVLDVVLRSNNGYS
jgi:hypothetical protein